MAEMGKGGHIFWCRNQDGQPVYEHMVALGVKENPGNGLVGIPTRLLRLIVNGEML